MTLNPEDDPIIGTMPIDFAYSEEQWSAVLAALPIPLAINADLDAMRRELEFVAVTCLNLAYHHRHRFEDGSMAARWKQKQKQIAADLASGEKAGCDESVLSDFREDLRHADVAIDGWTSIGRRHQGRQSPERDWLYDAALTAWRRLGGRLELTRLLFGRAEPSGPLIDFMVAVLTPIMKDDAPGPEALAKIVKRRRNAIERSEALRHSA
jgi:hypothetical protein